MLVVRATRKLRQRIGPVTLADGEQSTTLLGEWYAAAVPWRPHVALLVNAETLLPVLMPLAPATTMMARVGGEIATVLAAHHAPAAVIQAEVELMREWRVAPTASRSVVGIMNEFTALADTYHPSQHPPLLDLSLRLARTPCGPLRKRHGYPDRELAARLSTLDRREDHGMPRPLTRHRAPPAQSSKP